MIRNVISTTYRRYYSDLLVDLGIGQDINMHPHYLIKAKLETASEKPSSKPKCEVSESIYYNSKNIETKLSFLSKVKLVEFLGELPPLTSTNLFLDPTKKFKILLKGEEAFVVLKIHNSKKYLANLRRMKRLIEPLKNIFAVDSDFAILHMGSECYLVSKFRDMSLEDCTKEEKITLKQRKDTIKHLANLNELFVKKGVFFCGFAPRNFLVSNSRIYIIDFEDLYYSKSLSSENIRYLQDLRTALFSDTFSQQEISEIFASDKLIHVPEDRLVTADPIEKAYFRKSRIKQEERNTLWEYTKNLEQVIFYKNRPIYGHNIGQFFSDNLDPKLEALLIERFYIINQQDRTSFEELTNLFDLLTDYYSENKFRELYNQQIRFDFVPLIKQCLKVLESDFENTMAFVRYFNQSNCLDKSLSFSEKKKVIEFVNDVIHTKIIHKTDFSNISLFSNIVAKTVYGPWKSEAENIGIINTIYPYSPKKIKIYSHPEYATILYEYYGKSNLSFGDSKEAARLLAKLHNTEINDRITGKLKSKYLKLDDGTIKMITEFLSNHGYIKDDLEMIYERAEALKRAFHPKSVIHNDLYYDQFHKNKQMTLLDWTYATVGSPFIDLSSILRNDYDNRNAKLDKRSFLDEYLKYSKYSKEFSDQKLIEGFYMNCFREIVWFIERINLDETHGGEVDTWLKDAVNDLKRNEFVW
ncbi:hypothetical protein A3A71_01165 [Candidatus Berkelbacteria bacterium RIFCSPLOWO2_01_FULL_50_28]|uniref:Uncharacterized protein n=1 Tax=Candidatus Berkelbacteria bacterium RIFCSPLOWO2_01_FULL_50_28 TaxID=1797471 RepID=A0A1F5EB57_9BACT|nr:MAG: hypothetical protein A2807_01735 [Candidatus Berkelbacteria bacterium RIFCSPHIGHO2_01_FULL_50_36]OGD63483.1 MAG: hypothetical protein A3F39_03300 [Candidatus Berkelbacteria bacterium RIFCSPHIGHO2_12_FULL_50_11]OGD64647.1 MAG: hypothetical protein A3A71_01165 [Candidatus Berkelbacteria bacterium RIFCSPLOWO2_01_FULL_50_28]